MADVDLVMRLEDLPNKNKQVLQDLLLSSTSKNKSTKDLVSEFLGQFNSDYKNGNIEHMNFLTDYAFHKLSEDHFKEKLWPKSDSFEESLGLHENVKLLYKELCYRHLFCRLQTSHADVEARCDSWNNYMELFKALIPEDEKDIHKIELPTKWIWEIFDESIYQFQNFNVYATKLKKDDPVFTELKSRTDMPNFTQFEGALKHLLSKSQVMTDDGQVKVIEKPKTRQFVGYYSYLALIKLYVVCGKLDEAYDLIQKCSLDYIKLYLKRSWCALISFFYFAGLTYILKNEILKGTKILEKCCSFFYRYKHFLSKSMQIDKYNRLAERSTLLLTIFLSFNKIETEDNINRVISEKYAEKYAKLLKYDQTTFEETFTSGCCKIVRPLMSPDKLEDFNSQESVDLVPGLVQNLLGQLNKYRILNGVESVLLIYSKLSIEKLAKILSLDAREIGTYLAEYEAIRQATLKDTPFEQTFLQKAMANLRTHKFEILGGDITVKKIEDTKADKDSTIKDFIEELTQSARLLKNL